MNTLTNFKRTSRLAWLAVGAMLLVPASSWAQAQPAPPPPAGATAEQQPVVVIKKESKLVLVDSVVTDKKGNYVRELTQNDFKVFEDNKEQPVSTFSTGADVATQANGQRRYLILFFDNSTMAAPDQIQARSAATKFIAANAGPDRLMAVVDFGGSLRIVQNFTANADVLRAAVSGVKSSSVDPNAPAPDVPVTVASTGLSSLGNAAADFGARSMLLAVRSLAKNLRAIPGRKMVVLFSGGFALTQENQSELTATIDACNKSNVAVYALDARGLVATAPGGSAGRRSTAGKTHAVSNHVPARKTSPRPHILLAAYPAMAMPDPQRPGGGGGTGGGGTGGGGRGGTGGGGTGGGGTGGFTIFNTNDLLAGLERIGREQNEFYILGYVPPDSAEGTCHTLKVKLNRGGMNVRSRSGYCNTKTANVLEGKPLEKQLESHATGSQAGSIHGVMEAPYFYTAPDTARVSLAMEIPSDTIQFNKEKGKYHANLNVLGIAYRPDGTVGAKFSDTVNMDLEKDEWKEFAKSPYHYENQFDAAPGAYKLTVVLSAGGDAFGKFESPLTIDPYDGKHFNLGGLALTKSAQRVNDIPSGLDSVLLEDRTPLLVKGFQIIPSGSNRFKHTDNVIVYTEIYEPLLTSANPPLVGMGYRIFERASNKQIFFTEVQRADDYIQKGNPVIPIGMKVAVNDLKPGSYRLMMQAVDSAKNHAPDRVVDFDITD